MIPIFCTRCDSQIALPADEIIFTLDSTQDSQVAYYCPECGDFNLLDLDIKGYQYFIDMGLQPEYIARPEEIDVSCDKYEDAMPIDSCSATLILHRDIAGGIGARSMLHYDCPMCDEEHGVAVTQEDEVVYLYLRGVVPYHYIGEGSYSLEVEIDPTLPPISGKDVRRFQREVHKKIGFDFPPGLFLPAFTGDRNGRRIQPNKPPG